VPTLLLAVFWLPAVLLTGSPLFGSNTVTPCIRRTRLGLKTLEKGTEANN
jgi:hypothetical protein